MGGCVGEGVMQGKDGAAERCSMCGRLGGKRSTALNQSTTSPPHCSTSPPTGQQGSEMPAGWPSPRWCQPGGCRRWREPSLEQARDHLLIKFWRS